MPGRTLGRQREVHLCHAPLLPPSPEQHAEGYMSDVHETRISPQFSPFYDLAGQIAAKLSAGRTTTRPMIGFAYWPGRRRKRSISMIRGRELVAAVLAVVAVAAWTSGSVEAAQC